MKYLLLTPVAALIILLLFLLMAQLAGLGGQRPDTLPKLVDPAGFDLSEISFDRPVTDAPALASIELPSPSPLQDSLAAVDMNFSVADLEVEIEVPELLEIELDFALELAPLDNSLSEIEIPVPVVKKVVKKAAKKKVKKIVNKVTKKPVKAKIVAKQAAAPVAVQPVAATSAVNHQPGASADKSSANHATAGSGKISKPISQVRPRYPKRARRRGVEGEVVVSFVIAANGSVERGSLRITRSRPAKVFDRAVLKAVVKWKFPSSARAHRSSQRLVFKLDK